MIVMNFIYLFNILFIDSFDELIVELIEFFMTYEFMNELYNILFDSFDELVDS